MPLGRHRLNRTGRLGTNLSWDFYLFGFRGGVLCLTLVNEGRLSGEHVLANQEKLFLYAATYSRETDRYPVFIDISISGRER
jgi:hypothetical protein